MSTGSGRMIAEVEIINEHGAAKLDVVDAGIGTGLDVDPGHTEHGIAVDVHGDAASRPDGASDFQEVPAAAGHCTRERLGEQIVGIVAPSHLNHRIDGIHPELVVVDIVEGDLEAAVDGDAHIKGRVISWQIPGQRRTPRTQKVGLAGQPETTGHQRRVVSAAGSCPTIEVGVGGLSVLVEAVTKDECHVVRHEI